MRELTIDPEFAAIGRRLTLEEQNWLELSLDLEGCRDAIVVWANHDDTILDGHTRYRYCRANNIPFKTVALALPSREEALEWIKRTALGRRNLTEEEKAYLRGKQYLGEKKAAKFEAGNPGGPGRGKKRVGQNDPPSTADRLAAERGVSARTVKRDADYAKGLDAVAAKFGQETRDAILSRKRRVKKNTIQAIGRQPKRLDNYETADALCAAEAVKGRGKLGRVLARTISEQAKAVRAEIETRGLSRKDALMKYPLTESDYNRASIVVEHGHTGLIAAMDAGRLTISKAYTLVSKMPEKIDATLDELQRKEAAKRYRDVSGLTKKPPFDQIYHYIHMIFDYWLGFRLKVNGATLRSTPEKLADLKHLCQRTRKAGDERLDSILAEVDRCLRRTTERKTS